MLPIFRIISVGGVTLAIAILVLALIPPGGTHLVLAQHEVVARGALMDASQHPEWRQFLIHAALRRAGELEQLRDLRDTVIRAPDPAASKPETRGEALTEAAAPKLVGLPVALNDAEPEDITGSLSDNPGATLPIDIGEASSTELPVMAVEESPPAIRVPVLQAPPAEAPPVSVVAPSPARSETKTKPEAPLRVAQQRSRRKPALPAPEPTPIPPPFNILAAIFSSFANAEAPRQPSRPAAGRTPEAPPDNRQALSSRAVLR
jgi:hypothetical protein